MRGTVCHSTSRPVTSVAGENEEAVVVEASAQAGGGSPDDPLGTVLDQLRQGRPILVVGPGERDTAAVLAAESCTAEMAQWLIRNGTGIIAAPIEASRADRLGLALMTPSWQKVGGSPQTVTADVAGLTAPGASSAGRAATLRALADPDTTIGDLVRPGHVVALREASGGLPERPGHTEVSVALMRAADLQPVAVMTELSDDAGEILTRDQARAFAREHWLEILDRDEAVRALLDRGAAAPQRWEVPQEHDASVTLRHVADAELPLDCGILRMHAFRDADSGVEHLALVGAADDTFHGALVPPSDPVVRVHTECVSGDALGSRRCNCSAQLRSSLETVAQLGGVVLYLRGQDGRGLGLAEKVRAYALEDSGLDTVQAHLALGHQADERDYTAAVEILRHLGITRVQLLTNNPTKVDALRAGGIEVTAVLGLNVGATSANERYLRAKRDLLGHTLPDGGVEVPHRGPHHRVDNW